MMTEIRICSRSNTYNYWQPRTAGTAPPVECGLWSGPWLMAPV